MVLKAIIPRYPARLEAAGISGKVMLEFVSSSVTDFEAAAKEAILATRFRPARARGIPVRQLARQAIWFRTRG